MLNLTALNYLRSICLKYQIQAMRVCQFQSQTLYNFTTMPVIQATPQVQVPSPEQTVPSEENIMERPVLSVSEETRHRSMRIQAKPKSLIEEM